MDKIGGATAIIGTIIAVLTFYLSTYLPYINGENTPATEALAPVLEVIPNAKTQHSTNTDRATSPGEDTNPGRNTTPPVISVPNDITVEAASSDGAQVSFEVSAQDDVDGAVDVSCDHNSGDTFSIGETDVTCTAEDSAGNPAEKSFTITVQGTSTGRGSLDIDNLTAAST